VKTKVLGIALIYMGLVLGLTCQSMAEIDLKNLTGLWMFDEGSGNRSEALSGNENHLEFIDNVQWVDGRFGKAVMFDGISSYAETPDHLNPTEAITVTAWAISPSATWDQHGWLVEKREAYILHPVQSTPNMAWCVANGGQWSLPSTWDTGQVGPDDITEWHMYTATFDSATGEWKLYIDGELESELDVNEAPLMEDAGPIYVGQDT